MTDLTPLVEESARAIWETWPERVCIPWDERRDDFKNETRREATRALLAFFNPDSEAGKALVRLVGIALWEANYGYANLRGKATDPYQCDPNGCGPKAHAAHQGLERWQESEEESARAALTAIARALTTTKDPK